MDSIQNKNGSSKSDNSLQPKPNGALHSEAASPISAASLGLQLEARIAEIQAEIELKDERDAIREEWLRAQGEGLTRACALASLERAERFAGEHAIARQWMQSNEADKKRFIRHTDRDAYALELFHAGITFTVDRLRREKYDLFGELSVRCDLSAGAVDGLLVVGDFNLTSVRAREQFEKLLIRRAGIPQFDWYGPLEEFARAVIDAEREGDGAIELSAVTPPEADDDICMDGLTMPRRHPTILFGDGGSAKSYTALYLAGQLAQQGLRVAYFDWELCAEDHRVRLQRLFGAEMPQVVYARCTRPLVAEADRLRQIVRDRHIDFAVYDSAAVACDGRPEDAEVTSRYFRAVGNIGAGSLHIAHVNRSESGDQKPFGSSFWFNLARCIWFVQAVESRDDESHLTLGFFNRKANLGAKRSPAGSIIQFTADRTLFQYTNIADIPAFAEKASLWQRLKSFLRDGAKPRNLIVTSLECTPENLRQCIRRHRTELVEFDDGRLGLQA